MDQFGHNPALVDLEFLTGEWETELSNAPFLPSRADTGHGHVTCEWMEDCALLVLRQSEHSGSRRASRSDSKAESARTGTPSSRTGNGRLTASRGSTTSTSNTHGPRH